MQAISQQSQIKGTARTDRTSVWPHIRGWTVRDRNFEIDFIAEDRKQGRIAQVGKFYIAMNPDISGRSLRFDIIHDRNISRIRQIEGAFYGGVD